MKVLQINSVCGVGSTGRIVTDIDDLLLKMNDEGLIAYGRKSYKKSANTFKIGNKLDVYSHVLLTRIFDRHGFGSKKATEDLLEYIKSNNPDIIHLHNIHGYYINIEYLFEFLQNLNVPVVWTLHDCWAFTGHCSHYDFIKCTKWIDGCEHCPQKREYPKSLLIDNSYENYNKKKELFSAINDLTIVTPSKWLAKQVEKSFLNKQNINVINNGIDLTVFKPTDSSFKIKYHLQDKKVLLGVSSIWNSKKGLYDFIKLAKELHDGYKIVLVGVSKAQIQALPPNIIGITSTENMKELAEIYTAADMFLNLSYEETMGLVSIEALACGTPVIVNNTTALPEFITKKCGRVVEPGNIKDIINAIKEIEGKIEANECISVAGNYNKNDKYMEYIRLYKSILLNEGGVLND